MSPLECSRAEGLPRASGARHCKMQSPQCRGCRIPEVLGDHLCDEF